MLHSFSDLTKPLLNARCISVCSVRLSLMVEHQSTNSTFRVKFDILPPKWPSAPTAQSSHLKPVLARLVDTELPFLILPGILKNVYLEGSWPHRSTTMSWCVTEHAENHRQIHFLKSLNTTTFKRLTLVKLLLT